MTAELLSPLTDKDIKRSIAQKETKELQLLAEQRTNYQLHIENSAVTFQAVTSANMTLRGLLLNLLSVC